tara:strand:+ start:2387 stop:2638 length:252 start_codon:yes stop_codon:yes gene_type:complete
MKEYDIKKKLDEKKEIYSELISFIFSKKTKFSKDVLNDYLLKSIDKSNDNLFKNISEDKYNKGLSKSLEEMSIEELDEKVIKD